ncbi:MAG: glutathione S-transferase [Pseudomonadota bacterium]
MRLYHNPASPFVRKVHVLVLEAGRADEVDLVPAAGTPLAPGSMPLAYNPLGKIPCLERPDGPALYDSRVICRYLNDRFAAGLYPDAPRLWETLTLEALADGIKDAAVLMRYERTVRPEDRQLDAFVDAQWDKIARALAALEAGWMGYLAAPPDMGQFALACALGYLDFRHGERDWRRSHPGLAGWEQGMRTRASLSATMPEA